MKKVRNPLIKRVPKELVAEWHKYLVIILFMVLMIGVISGMYVGHDSMLASIASGVEELQLEDGSFELKKKASADFLEDLATGGQADVRSYFIEKGRKEADKEVAEAIEEEVEKQVTEAIEKGVRTQCEAFGITDEAMIAEQTEKALKENFDDALKEAKESEEFQKASDDAYKEAHEKVEEKVDEEWDKITDRYNLNAKDFFRVPVTLYEHFYIEAPEESGDKKEDVTIRLYQSDSDIDRAAFLEGRSPKTDGEIAIDRMHAHNLGIAVGDSITVGGKKFKVVGLLSYVNYLTLHQSNTDLMFDAFGFDVGMVTPEAFEGFSQRVHYEYAYKYQNSPGDKIAEADYAESFLKSLITQTLVYDNEIKGYLPEYVRQASNFAVSDIEGDSSTTAIMCYILIAVIAFIFAITISNTIEKEASVIGTLRASGYSKGELILHYMSMPVIITLIGALIGNILGYTAFRSLFVDLYYESYSLPPCSLAWSKTALIKTTVIPLVLMFFINLFIIVSKLQISPLRFLRHDLVRNKKTKARRLPSWSFLKRFRLRILFQNMPNYLVLIFGVIFVELMLCFAFGVMDSLTHYGEKAPDMIFADYQYMLTSYQDEDDEVIKTSEKSAEAFAAKTLMYPRKKSTMRTGMGSGGDESVTVYGIAKGSEYVSLSNKTDEKNVYISSAFAKKFDLSEGGSITLHEEYENKSYDFTVAGIVDYDGGIATFMDISDFNSVFEKEKDEFSGYFSRNEITDIDEKYIATVITADDIAKVTNQLLHSFGGIMGIFKYAMIGLSAALIYLLAKIIIERNEHSISMAKILGFLNGEIGSLYIVPTAIVVILFAIISYWIGYYLMLWIFKAFIIQMDGYFAFYITPVSAVLSVLYLLIGYAIVSVIDFIRIRRIPLDVALKNIE
ncbi:MAG: permease [Lachnospiraceae bacterium]|nr:permease [Lachnospiraceae bacterium]